MLWIILLDTKLRLSVTTLIAVWTWSTLTRCVISGNSHGYAQHCMLLLSAASPR